MDIQLQQLRLLEMEKRQLLLKLSAVEKAIFAYRNVEGVKKNPLQVEHNEAEGAEIEQLFKKYHDYNALQPTKNKVLHIIKKENRFLHVREIVRIACRLEDETSTSIIIKKVSPALSILKRLPGSPVTSIEIFDSHFNTFWGCKDWLTSDGKIIEYFMYNTAELKKTDRENIFSI